MKLSSSNMRAGGTLLLLSAQMFCLEPHSFADAASETTWVAPAPPNEDPLVRRIRSWWSPGRLAFDSIAFDASYVVEQYTSAELEGENNDRKTITTRGSLRPRLRMVPREHPGLTSGELTFAARRDQSFLKLVPKQVDAAAEGQWFATVSMYARDGTSVAAYRADDKTLRRDVVSGPTHLSDQPVGIFLPKDVRELLGDQALPMALGMTRDEFDREAARYHVKVSSSISSPPGGAATVTVRESLTVDHLISGQGTRSAARTIVFSTEDPYLPSEVIIERYGTRWSVLSLTGWTGVEVDGVRKWYPRKFTAMRFFPEVMKPNARMIKYDSDSIEVDPTKVVTGKQVMVPDIGNEVPPGTKVSLARIPATRRASSDVHKTGLKRLAEQLAQPAVLTSADTLLVVGIWGAAVIKWQLRRRRQTKRSKS